MLQGFRRTAATLSVAAIAAAATSAPSAHTVLVGAPGSGFGSSVRALPNGNFLVGTYDSTAYLYRPDGTLIRLMTNVQIDAIVPLGATAFLLVDPDWNNGAGAVTRVDASTGLTEPVSAANSIVGSAAGDKVGYGGVVVLANGDYLVCSPNMKIGGAAKAGAVTRVSGSMTGTVTATNSLVGSQANDLVGAGCAKELANGNYVVSSPYWANGAATRAGAATWCSGTAACTGPVSTANSLVGSQTDDVVGDRITPLTNGNYVVSTSAWNLGTTRYVGAATWGNGATGTVGVVSPANSLVGATQSDNVGDDVFALRNGHYVVTSPRWDNGGQTDLGAVTWGNGNGGLVGNVTAANSLVGSTPNDSVGADYTDANEFLVGDPVVPLDNGHYLVNATFWSGPGALRAGAVAWANGNGTTTGTISSANALVGTSPGDRIGESGITKLANGHYVVASTEWKNGTVERAGAATWGNANGGTVGPVSAANSLVGTTYADLLPGAIVPLRNGHYVIATPRWRTAGLPDVGAVTWSNGNGSTVGTVSMLNSLTGTTANDLVGIGVVEVGNGNYVIRSPGVDSHGLINNGAVTWVSGAQASFGGISAARSLVGARNDDAVGGGGARAFADGHYVVFSYAWDDGTSTNVGAATLLPGNSSTSGMPEAWNSEFGTAPDAGYTLSGSYDPTHRQLILGRSTTDRVTLLRADRIFAMGFD